MVKGKIVAVCRSKEKGTLKKEIEQGELLEGYGLKGDAHGGDWHRQLSLLGEESIKKLNCQLEENGNISYGDLAENITTRGITLYQLTPGIRLRLGEEAVIEITQIGKECHDKCEIFQQVGSCIMPTEGVFAKIVKGGTIKTGDSIQQL